MLQPKRLQIRLQQMLKKMKAHLNEDGAMVFDSINCPTDQGPAAKEKALKAEKQEKKLIKNEGRKVQIKSTDFLDRCTEGAEKAVTESEAAKAASAAVDKTTSELEAKQKELEARNKEIDKAEAESKQDGLVATAQAAIDEAESRWAAVQSEQMPLMKV